MLDLMLRHQAEDGRYLTPGGTTGNTPTGWASLPCEHFAVLEVLLLYGRRDAPGVDRALRRMRETFADTPQGAAWHCIPDPVAKWRGPGRKNDACPQVTVEALRLFALVEARARPRRLAAAARTLLATWRRRDREKPYMFGHGRRFVAGKRPPTWYDASAVLEALAAYPSVWNGRAAARSCYRGFEAYSFGQKKRPSPWATARACGLLRTFSPVIATRAA